MASFPFSSARKRMTSVVESGNKKYTVYCKGASEIVLDQCTSIMDDEGNISYLTSDFRNQLKDRIESMAGKGTNYFLLF